MHRATCKFAESINLVLYHFTGGTTLGRLPLPLAAFVSLTITYKLDKASERFLNLAGPALENLAASCP